MVKAYVLIGVESGEEKKVSAALAKKKEIQQVHELFGEWDLIAQVEVEKVEELDDFVTDGIRSLPQVKLTSTLVVAR